VLSRQAGQAGDVAWVVTHSRMTGTYKDRELDFTSREFLLLRREGDAWKIAVVEWNEK